ncbi:MAG: hypothetical protein ACI82Z_000931 [Cellvibrionaceae bacterium]|jgi:hypothetical protein
MDFRPMDFRPIVALFLFTVLLSPLSFSATFDVNSNLDENDSNLNDGVCEASVFGRCTLRAAIQQANDLDGADVINLPIGIYDTASQLVIDSEVSIIGEDMVTTVVNADNSIEPHRLFSIVTDGAVSLSGFTIQGGDVRGRGLGGGIFLDANVDLTLYEINLSDNRADIGGAIADFFGARNLSIHNSVIANNTAIALGGGLSLYGGEAVITNTTIRGNRSIDGGGLSVGRMDPTNLVVVNTTISSNQAANNGAGIQLLNGSVSLYNTTVTDNQADSNNDGEGSGGGLFASDNSTVNRNVTINHSIIAGNLSNTGSEPDCRITIATTFTSEGYNILGDDRGCSFVAGPGDQIGDSTTPVDPLLGLLSDNGGPTETHPLLNGSPAIDAGRPAGCIDPLLFAALTTDQRGMTRPLDGGSGAAICDIGAYEYSEDSGDSENNSSGSSGGGCTISLNTSGYDPIFPLMLALSALYLLRRRVSIER